MASRLGKLPCSKELIPIPGDGSEETPAPATEPVAARLVRACALAGASRVSWILRHGKWDIPAYFGSGAASGVSMNYSVMEYPYGPPFTLNEAWHLYRNDIVLLGFPDILISHRDPFSSLVDRLRTGSCDVALAVVTAPEPTLVDVVRMDDQSRIHQIIPKPSGIENTDAWLWAAWTPVFSEFLHKKVEALLEPILSKGSRPAASEIPEVHVGHIIDAFIQDGGSVQGVRFPDTRFLDIGTPDGFRAIPHFFNH
jgi:glucose-1-phosphate thymidylyltransferase